MGRELLILTPAIGFSEQLQRELAQKFPSLRVHIAPSAAEAMPVIASIHGLLTVGSAITDELLQAAGRLEWIQSLGTGVDGIVDRATLAPQVIVTNARGLFDEAVSECALALMFALARDLPRVVNNKAARRWEHWTPSLLSGKHVGKKKLGAIG